MVRGGLLLRKPFSSNGNAISVLNRFQLRRLVFKRCIFSWFKPSKWSFVSISKIQELHNGNSAEANAKAKAKADLAG